MFRQRVQVGKREAGFTLIELMIVVAIIGILAAIAVPNFITYRNKSLVAATVSTGDGVRAAIASFAADSANNLYPAAIAGYNGLRDMANANGGTLPAVGTFTVTHYTPIDTDGDLVMDDYTMRVDITGVPTPFRGKNLVISPTGILRCTNTTAADCI